MPLYVSKQQDIANRRRCPLHLHPPPRHPRIKKTDFRLLLLHCEWETCDPIRRDNTKRRNTFRQTFHQRQFVKLNSSLLSLSSRVCCLYFRLQIIHICKEEEPNECLPILLPFSSSSSSSSKATTFFSNHYVEPRKL